MSDHDWLEEKETSIVQTSFNELAPFSNVLTSENIVSVLMEKYSAPQSYVVIRKWKEMFEEAEKSIKDKANTGSKSLEVTLDGKVIAVLETRSLPKKFEYEDNSLEKMNLELNDLKAKIKERETFLQGLKKEVCDTETGEISKPAKKIEVGSTIAVIWK